MFAESFSISISERAAEEFLSCLQSTMSEMAPQSIEDLYVHVRSKGALVVSYRGTLEPFLGETPGLNEEDQKNDLKDDLAVLKLIQGALMAVGRPGGRVFLTSTRAYSVEMSEKQTLVRWEWPGQDLVTEAVALLEEAKSTAH